MKLVLEREYLGSTFTEGSILIYNIHECFTIEDKDRQLEDTGCASKVQNQTCIPRGTYPVTISYSNRFKKHLIAILNVPCFSGIRIHSGNSSKDTEGCIIVGRTNNKDTDDWVSESRVAYEELHKKVKYALSKGEEVTITIQ